MRDISYRAKRKDNGEWVYGVPLKEGYSQEVEMLWYEYGSLAYTERAQVIPETVGQYTGLTDKNGKKIFEGDIIEGHCHSQWSRRLQRCVVEYDRDSFEARHYVEQGGVRRYYTYKVLFSKDIVVIGNIHDNPELLEVK